MSLPDISHLSLPHSYPSVPSGQDNAPSDLYRRPAESREGWQLFAKPSKPLKQGQCPLMTLPREIRELILTYVLPHTTIVEAPNPQNSNRFLWRQGCTSILATCKKLHEESSRIMYDNSNFLIQVHYESIRFLFYRLLKSGLRPRQTPDFERTVKERYWHLIRRVSVRIDVEDDYTAEIKYNYRGEGLVAGVRARMLRLVEVLGKCERLITLEVLFECQRSNAWEVAEKVLEPFFALRNVRSSVWKGHLGPDLAGRLSSAVCMK